jgi:hypothetical protein
MYPQVCYIYGKCYSATLPCRLVLVMVYYVIYNVLGYVSDAEVPLRHLCACTCSYSKPITLMTLRNPRNPDHRSEYGGGSTRFRSIEIYIVVDRTWVSNPNCTQIRTCTHAHSYTLTHTHPHYPPHTSLPPSTSLSLSYLLAHLLTH